MKRMVSLTMAVLLALFSLTGCEAAETVVPKSEAVINTEALIEKVVEKAGELEKAINDTESAYTDNEFYDSLQKAKKAYNELSDDEKNQVENYELVEENEMKFYGDFLADYASADDLVNMLIDKYYSGSRDYLTYGRLQTLKNNTKLHHFFQEEEKENHIARKLYEGVDAPGYSYDDKKKFSGKTIFELYYTCNDSSTWFWNINYSGQTPLVFCASGIGAEKYGVPLYLEKIAEDIKDDFKDPHSVSVEKAMMFAPEIDNNETVFPSPLKIIMKAKVRATNSYGAFVTQNFAIEFKYPKSRVLNEIDDAAYDGSLAAFYVFPGYQSGGWDL